VVSGSSFVNRRRQRQEAIAHIDVMAGTPSAADVLDGRLRAV
jgi:hypothetical protein